MTFTLPPFSRLIVHTLNLETRLSSILERYTIIDNTLPPAAAPIDRLKILIARTNKVIECKTDRTTARDVFAKLVSELREVVLEGNEEKIHKSTLFLLGALIHRYFRIIKEYENYGYGYFGPTTPTSCTLFNAIRECLQFDTKLLKGFLPSDLKILDVTTIVHALETFRENMLIEDAKKHPRYMSYDHFSKKDPNFIVHLTEIIDEHKKTGKDILADFKAVQFLQSLAKHFDNEHKQIEGELKKWGNLLASHNPDYSKLTIELVVAHIEKHIQTKDIKEKILDLLSSNHIESNFAKLNHETFLKEMNSLHLSKSGYTILGGYSLILHSKGIGEKLKGCIYKSLEIEKNPAALDVESMLYGIKFLNEHVQDDPTSALDCSFFGGRDKLVTQIAQKEQFLIDSIKEKAPKEKAAAETSGNALSI